MLNINQNPLAVTPMPHNLPRKKPSRVQTPHLKFEREKSMPVVKLHSGRTNLSFGHNVLNARFLTFNTDGASPARRHYHHGYGPHQHPNGICPYMLSPAAVVNINNPASGSALFVGEKLHVRARVLNAARVELLINNKSVGSKGNLMDDEVVFFDAYEFISKDCGETDITVIAYADNEGNERSAVSSVKVNVSWKGFKPVTTEQMETFGWKNNSQAELDKLNHALQYYGIVHPDSVCLFLATCGHESGKGGRTLEYLNDDGTVYENRYPAGQRGAGYIQLTWRSNHLSFLISVNDSFNGEDTATYIAENYPWEAAAWFWSGGSRMLIDDKSINDYVATYGTSIGVFLITQCYVNQGNGYALSGNESAIKDSTVTWYIENGEVFVGEKDHDLAPENWNDREKNYNEAVTAFK